jgi:hypothetical protein
MALTVLFSRHARRRMQLYAIDEVDVVETIRSFQCELVPEPGKNEVVNKDLSAKHGYPLKVVFFREQDIVSVVTSYPLKRGRKNEDSLRQRS